MELKNNKENIGIDINIPLFEKLILAFGSGLSTLYYVIVTNWLLYFYTDIISINSKLAGAIMLIIRLISAVILLGFGLLLDQNVSKWGKYKPWLIISWLFIGVSGYLLFRSFNFNSLEKITYIIFTFTFFTVSTSINSVAGSGFGLTLTKRNEDRLQISLFSYISILIFSIFSYVLFLPIVNTLGHNNFGKGISKLMLVIMDITFFQAFLIFAVLNERFILSQIKESSKNVFLYNVKLIFKNKYVIISMIYNFSLQLFNIIKMSVTVYYFKYYFNDINMVVVSGAISLLPSMIAALISPIVTKKIGVKKVIILGVVANILSSIFIFFVPPTRSGKLLFYLMFTIGSIFLGLCQPAQGILMPMAADYSEWKYKVNIGGLLGSINNFIQIIATAIGNGVVGLILGYVKYVPNAVQSNLTLTGIKISISVIPAFIFLFGLVILFWDLNEEKHKKIILELKGLYINKTEL